MTSCSSARRGLAEQVHDAVTHSTRSRPGVVPAFSAGGLLPVAGNSTTRRAPGLGPRVPFHPGCGGPQLVHVDVEHVPSDPYHPSTPSAAGQCPLVGRAALRVSAIGWIRICPSVPGTTAAPHFVRRRWPRLVGEYRGSRVLAALPPGLPSRSSAGSARLAIVRRPTILPPPCRNVVAGAPREWTVIDAVQVMSCPRGAL